MAEPHPSSSSEHLDAEGIIKSGLARVLGLEYMDPPPALQGLQLDGYAEGDSPVLLEVFAHVGPSKSGQQRKLSRDMTKLLLAERRLKRACRKIVAVLDKDAIAHTTNGWDGDFAREFGIEFHVIPTSDELLQSLRAVQQRQCR